MSTTYTWKIAQLERETADGYVFTAHYTVDAEDGTYRAGAYGSIGLERPEGDMIPFADLTEGGFSGVYTNMTFEWSVINTGSGVCAIGAGTDHTIVGTATCIAGNSARFATRRTASNTFVSYRIV